MASTIPRSSRKRGLTCAQAVEPRAKRLRSWKKKHCTLLELPAEVRLSILKELLWQREPLKITEEAPNIIFIGPSCPRPEPRQCNFHFSPAILRTCRDLRKEGIEVLYNNTITCEVWCDFEIIGGENPYLSSFLRPDWDLNDGVRLGGKSGKRLYKESFLLSNVKRLDVLVRAAADDECYAVREAVRQFVKITRRLPQLSHMKIRLDLPESPGIPSVYWSRQLRIWTYQYCQVSREDYADLAIGPFAAIRGLKSATIDGVSNSLARELETVMTGLSAQVDLSGMLESLEDYIFKFMKYDHCRICIKTLGHLEHVRYAAETELEAVFRKVRAKIFTLVEEHNRIARLIAYENDPTVSDDTSHGDLTFKQCYSLLEDVDMDTHDIERELEQQSWDPRIDETDAERHKREEQEQQRPSLIKLREIALRDQATSLYGLQ